MFKILEIVQGKNEDLIDRYLPLQFSTHGEAKAHIELLQAHFLIRGYAEDGDYWWARYSESGELYRWAIGAVDSAPI
jgi:hypothetical protein